jgi:hypothetical protein
VSRPFSFGSAAACSPSRIWLDYAPASPSRLEHFEHRPRLAVLDRVHCPLTQVHLPRRAVVVRDRRAAAAADAGGVRIRVQPRCHCARRAAERASVLCRAQTWHAHAQAGRIRSRSRGSSRSPNRRGSGGSGRASSSRRHAMRCALGTAPAGAEGRKTLCERPFRNGPKWPISKRSRV